MNSCRTTQITILVSFGIACGGGASNPTPPPPPAQPASIAIAGGNNQQAAPGQAVGTAPAVVVRDAEQQPVAGVTVQFSVTAGGGSLQGATPVTDAAGIARVGRWTLGPDGDQRLSAAVGSLPPVTFAATLTTEPEPDEVVASFGPGGGSFEINAPEHPYRGLRLTVSAGTFTGSQSIAFSTVSNPALPSLPNGYRVSGPVLAISSSLGRGSKLMTLQVPITRPANEQVLLVFHDPVRRVTEVLPTVYRDDTRIIVATEHLRPDLMPGPGTATFRQSDPVGWLMPVSYQTPLADVASVLGPDFRWPVLDHGSASRPGGFGAAIAAIQSIAAASGLSLANLDPALATPGLYGDGAQLAAVARAAEATAGTAQSVSEFLASAGSIIQQQGGGFGKPQIDELSNHQIVAALAINGKPMPVALTTGGQNTNAVVATAVSGSNSTVGVLAAAAQSVASLTRQSAGYAQVAIQAVGGRDPVSVDRAIPLTSFVADFSGVRPTVQKLVQTSALAVGSAARIAATTAMLVEAGLGEVTVDIQGAPGLGFAATGNDVIVARSEEARIRVSPVGGSTGFAIHPPGGSQSAMSDGPELALADIPAIAAAPDLQPVSVVISAMREVEGVAKQVTVSTRQVLKAPFEVTPEEANISEPLTKVSFTASVIEPPAGGYGIAWEWDGGNIRSFQNTPTGNLEFIEVKDYTVIATLYGLEGGADLAKDTVRVIVNQPRHWHLATFVDVDNMLDDPDMQVGGEIPEQLLAILQDPATTMLSVVQTTANSTELQLRTMMNGTHWDPTSCCPPVPPGSPRSLTLGFDPAETNQYGSYFSEWNSSYWAESTSDQNSGTVTSQRGLGEDHVYNIRDIGSQVGPSGAVRMLATRNGDMITGRITFVVWFEDEEDGEMLEPADLFRFDFTAKRIR